MKSDNSPSRTDRDIRGTDEEFELFLGALNGAEERRTNRVKVATKNRLQRNCDTWSKYFHILREQFEETYDLFGTIQDRVNGWTRSKLPTDDTGGIGICDNGYYFMAEVEYTGGEDRPEMTKLGFCEARKRLLVSFGWYMDRLSPEEVTAYFLGGVGRRSMGEDGIGDESKLPFRYLRDKVYFLKEHYPVPDDDHEGFIKSVFGPDTNETFDVAVDYMISEIDESRLHNISYKDQLVASQHNLDLLKQHELVFGVYNDRRDIAQVTSIGVDVLFKHSLKEACQRLFVTLNQGEDIDLSRYLPSK